MIQPFLAKDRRDTVIGLFFAAACLLIAGLFPAGSTAQEMTKDLLAFVAMPILYVIFVAKEKLSSYGISAGNRKNGIIWGIANLAAVSLILIALVRFTDFSKNYRISEFAKLDFRFFVIYELVFANLSLFLFEFFWHGFVLSILSKRFGVAAVAIQGAAFIALSAITTSSWWQAIPFAIFAVTGGLAAHKAKSFLYSYISELLVIIALGAYLVRISH